MLSFSRLALASCLLAAATLPRVSAYSADDWTPSGAGLTGYTDASPIWRDEFEGTSLDRAKWDPKDIAWPDNGEQQYYTPDAVTVSDGELHITASHTPDALVAARGGRMYTSGRIDTTKSVQFKHGLFAARIKMTYSQGLWPAWWMFGTGPKYSEWDIAELVGGQVGKGYADDASYGALSHFSMDDMPTPNVTRGNGVSYHARDGTKFADDYYTMWMEWTPTVVTMGMDKQSQRIYDDVSKLPAFDSFMYLILNVAVGGYFPGDVDDTTVMPQSLDVSWVRVWNKNGEDIMRTNYVVPDEHHLSSSSTGSANGGSTPPSGSTDSNSGSSSSDNGSTPTDSSGNTPNPNTPSGESSTSTSTAPGSGASAVINPGGNSAIVGDKSGAVAGSVSVGLLVALVAAALFGQ